MRSHRFYSPLPLIVNQSFELPKQAAHHCIQVLRYKLEQELSLFNGDGFDYIAQIKAIDGKRCQVEITDKIALKNESPLNIHLYQGLARGEKMDLIIQKSVELGVNQVTPLLTERCNVKLAGKRLEKKIEHWQAIANSACEQSGRATLVTVNQPINIKQLQLQDAVSSIYLDPLAVKKISHYQKISSINLLIGPEGGFSQSDTQKLVAMNVTGLNLGPRILRTETAGLATIAILQSHFGDI